MKVSRVLSSIVVFSLVGLIVYAIYGRLKLNKDFKLTSGIVTECSFLPKSGGSIGVRYTYNNDKKVVSASSTYNVLTSEVCDEHFVGKSFPVAYNTTNELSAILIVPDDFKRFSYEFPDSLGWVLKYTRK